MPVRSVKLGKYEVSDSSPLAWSLPQLSDDHTLFLYTAYLPPPNKQVLLIGNSLTTSSQESWLRVSRILGSYPTLNRSLLLKVTNQQQDAKSFDRSLRTHIWFQPTFCEPSFRRAFCPAEHPKVGYDRLEPGNPASTLAMRHQVIPAPLPRTYAEQEPDNIPTRLIPHPTHCPVSLMQIRRTADYDQLSVLAGNQLCPNPDPNDALRSAI